MYPDLLAHSPLLLLGSRGEQWQECGTYSVLHNLYQTLTNKKLRVPIHVLLGGEDLLKREVLHMNDTNSKNHQKFNTYLPVLPTLVCSIVLP